MEDSGLSIEVQKKPDGHSQYLGTIEIKMERRRNMDNTRRATDEHSRAEGHRWQRMAAGAGFRQKVIPLSVTLYATQPQERRW